MCEGGEAVGGVDSVCVSVCVCLCVSVLGRALLMYSAGRDTYGTPSRDVRGAAGYAAWISGVSVLDEPKPHCGSYRKPETDGTVLDSLSSHPKAFPQVQELLPVLKCSV